MIERRVKEIRLLESAEDLKEQIPVDINGHSLRENTAAQGVFVSLSLSLFFFFVFLGPHPWHMEVPRLGVGLEV